MPTLTAHQSSVITKLLLLGDSGTGKTGALASLAKAGYNLRILDFDNGLDILANLLRDDPAALERVNFQICTDQTRVAGNQMIPGAQAWGRAIQTLGNWPDGIGKIDTWTPRDILVIDSITFAGKAAVRFVLNLNGRIADLPRWDDYYTAQGLLEKLLATLYSDSVKCNVIAISHVREIGKMHTKLDAKGRPVQVEEEGSRKGYAETGTGKALSPTIGRYFNAILLADIEGSGQSARRLIRTVPHGNIGLKNANPVRVKPSYPLATGLADYFAAVRQEEPAQQKAS